jgi:LmbE family N-acetylglucosaminyl deacetylase
VDSTPIEPPGIDLARVMVISPHFDDAVMSCGHLLAAAGAALVVTVFGGSPSSIPNGVTPWDASCGFQQGDDVVAWRRHEEAQALEALGVTGNTLELLDGQYRGGARYGVNEVAGPLGSKLHEWQPSAVVVPMALKNRDHLLARSAALQHRQSADPRTWVCYAEFPYVWREPDAAAKGISQLRRKGYRLTPVLGIPASPELKAASLAQYTSQLLGLRLDVARIAQAPEQLWLLTDRPPLRVRALRRAAWRFGWERWKAERPRPPTRPTNPGS